MSFSNTNKKIKNFAHVDNSKKKCIFADLKLEKRSLSNKLENRRCSSVVEYLLGKEGVMSSTLINGSFFMAFFKRK